MVLMFLSFRFRATAEPLQFQVSHSHVKPLIILNLNHIMIKNQAF